MSSATNWREKARRGEAVRVETSRDVWSPTLLDFSDSVISGKTRGKPRKAHFLPPSSLPPPSLLPLSRQETEQKDIKGRTYCWRRRRRRRRSTQRKKHKEKGKEGQHPARPPAATRRAAFSRNFRALFPPTVCVHCLAGHTVGNTAPQPCFLAGKPRLGPFPPAGVSIFSPRKSNGPKLTLPFPPPPPPPFPLLFIFSRPHHGQHPGQNYKRTVDRADVQLALAVPRGRGHDGPRGDGRSHLWRAHVPDQRSGLRRRTSPVRP